MRTLRSFLTVCAFLMLGTLSAFASKHGREPVVTATGIYVPALTHEQIGPMANAYSGILTLAEAMLTNPDMAANPAIAELGELVAYAKQERFYSVYGLVPGSQSYDGNPFHRPTHAALATAREILVRMNGLTAPQANEAQAMYGAVNEAMFRNGGEIMSCAYSSQWFNTLEPVGADFSRLPTQQNAVGIALVSLLIASFGMLVQGRRAARRRTARWGRA